MAIQRNLESAGDLWIQKWITGVYTQRSPLFTPISAMGIQLINRLDALWDGLNMEIGPKMTLIRRPAYSRFSSTAFGVNDYPLNFHSFQNTSGTIRPLVDTPGSVYSFTASTNSAVFTKGTTARGDFFTSGDYVYYCNGTDTKKWDGSTWTNWGITAPAAAPTFVYVGGALTTSNGGYTYGYAYANTASGHVSAMSGASASTGNLSSQNVTVSYTASADPQVNAIWIFRTTDGGGTYYFLAQVANATSSYTDSTADSGLNTFEVAPLSPNQAPCPAGASLVTSWDGRLWVSSGRTIYWTQSGTTLGVGDESFNLSTNRFKLPRVVKGFAPTSQGLLVFTSDVTWVITGAGGVYFINPWQKNFGIKKPGNIAQDGDLVFVFTSRSQLFAIGSTLNEIGFAIREKLAAMNPNNVTIAVHRSGTDEGLFVSDGSANVWRYSLAFQCWSPVGQPVQGAGVIASIETSDAVWTLLLGNTSGAKYISGRTTTNWTDDGGTYVCNAIVGSIIVSPPGKKQTIAALCLNITNTGTYPTLSILPNEISGDFTDLPNPVPEPPHLPASLTIQTMRHWLKAVQSPMPQEIQHMQVKVAFPSENFQGEVLGLAIL